MDKDAIQDLRERLCGVGKWLFDERLVTGTAGNISARVPDTEKVLIKPSGMCLRALKPKDFVVVDLHGRKLKGEYAVSVEAPIHLAVYRTRDDINGVVHSHAPTATAFGIANVKILPLTVESFIFIPKGVPIIPFLKPGSKNLADAVKKRIRGYNALILENHGILTVGASVEDACSLNIGVEEAAKLQFVASVLTGKKGFITLDDLTKRYTT